MAGAGVHGATWLLATDTTDATREPIAGCMRTALAVLLLLVLAAASHAVYEAMLLPAASTTAAAQLLPSQMPLPRLLPRSCR